MTSHSYQAVAGLCIALEMSQNFTEVREALRSAALALGATFFLFGMRTGGGGVPVAQVAISNYPKAWQRRYDESQAFAFDPVVARAYRFEGPFRWDGLYVDPRQLELYRDCLRHGMTYGMSTSERGAYGSVSILCFSGPDPLAQGAGDWERTAAAMSLLSTTVHKAVNRIQLLVAGRDEVEARLTDSEKRCLALCATGLRAKEVAARLRVKTRTVRYYLDSVAGKLGVDTPKEAVWRAVTDGLIDPHPLPTVLFGGATHLHE